MSAHEEWPTRTTDTGVIRDERTVVQGPAPVPPVKVIQQTPLSGGQAPRNAQILVFLGVLEAATHP